MKNDTHETTTFYCSYRKARAARVQRFTVWQQATIVITGYGQQFVHGLIKYPLIHLLTDDKQHTRIIFLFLENLLTFQPSGDFTF